MNDYKTCKHSYDTGGTCNSAAVTGRDYCGSHLRHRARQLRIAQVRARNQRFDLQLPPIESMATVFSALNQIVEAVAADMIDLKRADFLLKTLRFAAQSLKSSDKWQPSVFHTDVAAPAINLESEYGLPDNLDLNTSPEVAFPPPASAVGSEEVGWPIPPSFGGVGLSADLAPMPTVNYCQHGPGCPEHTIRADYPETPELAELREIQRTQGDEAMGIRYQQQQRNRRRRHIVTSRKRYAAIALEKNMRLAAERLAEQKLSERASAQPAAQEGCPIPPSFGGVGLSSDTTRKPVTSTTTGAAATEQEALSIA